jgi:hypothetical protein
MPMHMLKPVYLEPETAVSAPFWKYASSVYLPKYHCVIYRDDTLGIQKQVMTRRSPLFFSAREREFFFIDGDRRTFRSQERLMAALEMKSSR